VAEKVTGKDLKELRKPDEFQVIAAKILEWILAHQKQLTMAGGAVVVVALLAWGASTWKSHRESAAGEQLAEALRIEARPVAGEGFTQPGDETFASRDARNKAATDAFEKVRKDHANTVAALTATLQIGLLKQEAGDAAGAVAPLEEFLRDAPADHPMKPAALEALGYAYEAQGKLAEAQNNFGKLSAAGAPDRGAYQLARLAQVQGKPEAKDLLTAVAKDYSKDPVAMDANLRLEVAALPKPEGAASEKKDK
jgi:hypothetical protein